MKKYLKNESFADGRGGAGVIMPACTAVLDTFHPLSCDVLLSFISKLNITTCVLDSFPTNY